MIAGLERVKSHRIWFVPNLLVWGLPSWGELKLLIVEQVGSELTIGYISVGIGDTEQELHFEDLIDHRGNSLLVSLSAPRVIVRSRTAASAFVVATESDASFKIARDPDADGPVTVDLMIVEMGA